MIPTPHAINAPVHEKLLACYDALYRHNGFGEMTVEVRILKKGQKEIIIKSGRHYRFVVDWKNGTEDEKCEAASPRESATDSASLS